MLTSIVVYVHDAKCNEGVGGPIPRWALSEAPPAPFPQVNTHPATLPLHQHGLTSLRFPLVAKQQDPPCSTASDLRVGVLPLVRPSRLFTLEGRSCASVTSSLASPWGVADKSQVGLQAKELG